MPSGIRQAELAQLQHELLAAHDLVRQPVELEVADPVAASPRPPRRRASTSTRASSSANE
jgi:hypothetical protein